MLPQQKTHCCLLSVSPPPVQQGEMAGSKVRRQQPVQGESWVGKASLRQLGLDCCGAATWAARHSPVQAQCRVRCWQLPNSLYIS